MAVEVAAKIRPFWGRVTLVDSPVDEEQRDSGLIVPLHEADTSGLSRGVIAEVDRTWDEAISGRRAATDPLQPGVVVYYRGGLKLRGMVVVDPSDIVAFEESE